MAELLDPPVIVTPPGPALAPSGGALDGIMWGYTIKNMWGNVEPKYAPSIDPWREDLGEYRSSQRGQ